MFPKFVKAEGALGLSKGLVSLWRCQIPYASIKLASFGTKEYKIAIPSPNGQCSGSVQFGTGLADGYLVGVLCCIVSHSIDNLGSFHNNAIRAMSSLQLWLC